ncbi:MULTISPECIES: phage tail tape measure protein [Moraxella]|uniref:Phage tail tape measure protein domain-containing protein n=1 Tax=Moraxella catarrhalis TaxID=480 RepID=A0A7Z0UXR4_MORCA|nr:phage tail tape measure protein [Moraxella catarrhalis]OAV00233.1 hypothetical protein AO382_1383 [Moraxella catarrhalis]STY82501.1 Phage-related protein [Moraxella catarrhalis]
MSKLQLSVDLSLNDKLSQALEKAIKPAQELSDQFDDLKKSVEKFKLPDIDTSAFDKLKDEAQGVIKETERLSDELKKLDSLKLKLDRFEKIKKDTLDASTALTQHKKSIEALKAQMASGNADSAIKKQLSELEKEAKKLQNTVEKNTPMLKKMRQELNNVGLGGMKLSEAQAKVAADIKKTEVAIESQQGTLNRINNAYGNHATAVAKAKTAQEKLEKQIEQTGKKIERQKAIIEKAQKAREYGMEALRVAGSVAGSAGLAVKAYADSQDAETTLRISMMSDDGTVAKEYKNIVKLAEKMGNRLPGTTADFKQMMAVLVQQGISFQSILDGVGESAGNLAVLLKMPFDQAAEFAAKLQDATKTTEKDMMSLMDTVQKMYYLGADSTNILGGFKNLSSSMSVIGKQGKEFVDTVAPLIVMADQAGMNGDSAGNAYRKIFQKMMDTDIFNEAFKNAGVNIKFDFTDGKGEFGGFEKMFAQLSQLKGIDTERRIQILSDAFGNDAEVAQALNIMIEKGQAGYDEVVAKMARQADINQRVQAQLGTLRNLWDAAGGTATSLMARAGEALAPWVESLTKWLTSLGEKMGDWIDRHPKLFDGIVKFGAVLAGVITVIAALVVIISSVVIPIAALKMSFLTLGGSLGGIGKAVAVFGGAIAKIIPLLAGGLGKGLMLVLTSFGKLGGLMLTAFKGFLPLAAPLLLKIALIAGAAFLIYKFWKPIKAFFAGVWDGIKAAAEPIMPIFETIGNAIQPVLDWLGQFFNLTQVGEGSARSLGQTVGGFLAKSFMIATLPLRTLWAVGKWVWDKLTGLFSGTLSIGDIFAPLREKWDGLMSKITEYKDKAKSLWEEFKGLFTIGGDTGAGGSTSSDSGGFFSSLASGFEAARQSISEKAGSMWESAKAKFDEARQSLPAKASEIWNSITSSLSGANGINVIATIGTTMQGVIAVVSTAAQGVINIFGVMVTGIGTILATVPMIISTAFMGIDAVVAASVAALPAVIAVTLAGLPVMMAGIFIALAATTASGMAVIARTITARMATVINTMRSGFTRLRSVTAQGWRSLGSAMSGNPILSRLQSAMSAALSYLNGVKGRFFVIGQDIGNGLASGIESSIGRVLAAGARLAAAAERSARIESDTHSPSRKMAAVGSDMAAGLDMGLTRGFMPLLGNFTRNIGLLQQPVNTQRIVPVKTLAPASKGNAVSHYAGDTITININAPSGDARDIADQVRAVIEEYERKKAKRTRQSFTDRY